MIRLITSARGGHCYYGSSGNAHSLLKTRQTRVKSISPRPGHVATPGGREERHIVLLQNRRKCNLFTVTAHDVIHLVTTTNPHAMEYEWAPGGVWQLLPSTQTVDEIWGACHLQLSMVEQL